MRFAPYSFSKLSTYQQCPLRFKFKYIDKIPEGKFDDSALVKGSNVHSILENYSEVQQQNSIVEKFLKCDIAQKYLPAILGTSKSVKEFNIGLDTKLNPSKYSDKSTIFRGKVDLMTVIDKTLNIIDYKTGKYKEEKYQSYDQLMFYAIYYFIRYHKIDKIRISYVYLEAQLENEMILERKYLSSYIDRLIKTINSVETDTQFIKNKSILCNWCPYQETCEAGNDSNRIS